MPLIPRIKRLLEVPSIKDQLLRDRRQAMPPAIMRDVWDSPLVMDLFAEGAFGPQARDLAFAISIDGFDPFNHNKVRLKFPCVITTCYFYDIVQ